MGAPNGKIQLLCGFAFDLDQPCYTSGLWAWSDSRFMTHTVKMKAHHDSLQRFSFSLVSDVLVSPFLSRFNLFPLMLIFCNISPLIPFTKILLLFPPLDRHVTHSLGAFPLWNRGVAFLSRS